MTLTAFPDLLLTFFLPLLPPSSLSLGRGDGDVPFIENTLCVLDFPRVHFLIDQNHLGKFPQISDQ